MFNWERRVRKLNRSPRVRAHGLYRMSKKQNVLWASLFCSLITLATLVADFSQIFIGLFLSSPITPSLLSFNAGDKLSSSISAYYLLDTSNKHFLHQNSYILDTISFLTTRFLLVPHLLLIRFSQVTTNIVHASIRSKPWPWEAMT